MIKYVLFDMDGVLLDTNEFHYDSLNLALKDKKLKTISLSDYLKYFATLPTKAILKKYQELYNINLSNEEIKDIFALKQKYILEIADKELSFDKDKYEMITYLKTNDYGVACCSNAVRESLEFFLSKIGILKYFDFVLCNEDVANPKPHPDIYLKAIKKFNTTPEECLVFEDSENGINAAKEAKTHISVVSSPKILTKTYVEKVIKDFNDKI